jgi:hypothetical protein
MRVSGFLQKFPGPAWDVLTRIGKMADDVPSSTGTAD